MPWRDSFYPDSLGPSEYLSHYSRFFNFAEIRLGDTTKQFGIAVRGPSTALNYSNAGSLLRMSKRWAEQTPEGFKFAVAILPSSTSSSSAAALLSATPKAHTPDDGPDIAALDSMLKFLEGLEPVRNKVVTITTDIPSNLGLGSGRNWLESILRACTESGYPLAVQFGNRSWFQDLTYNLLRKYGASIIWPYEISQPRTNIVASVSNRLYFRLLTGGTSGSDPGYGRLVESIGQIAKEENIEDVILTAANPAEAKLVSRLFGAESDVEGFFSSASTWGVAGQQPATPGSGGGSSENHRTIICVDLNAFYPSCEEIRDPSLAGRPHAVIMTEQKRDQITSGVVSSCSYEARRYGVRSAMALSMAKSLCPDLILLPVDIPFYRRISDQVMSVLQPFADVLEQASIDEAFMDCTSKIGKRPHTEESLRLYGLEIKQAVKERCGLLCSVGIAPTKSASKMASDHQKPDGLVVIPVERLAGFLGPLEVGRVSGIGPKTEKSLAALGITTLGQLAGMDMQDLAMRFGKNGVWMWKVANGLDDEPVTPRGDHVSISAESTLDNFTRDREIIRVLLHELAGEIHERALEYGYSFRTIGVKLVRADFSLETREITYPEPMSERVRIESAIAPLLDKFELSDGKQAVRKAGLKLSHIARKDPSIKSTPAKKTPDMPVQKTLLDF